MNKQVSSKTTIWYWDTYAYLVSAGIHVQTYNIPCQVQRSVESILFCEEWAFRSYFRNESEPTCVKVHPLTEIIWLSVIAFPNSNEWLQAKISRNLIGKEIIIPTSYYIDALWDYLSQNYPYICRTRNMKTLAPTYALHLAARKALELIEKESLENWKMNDVQKLVCSLPFAVASRQEFPLDVVLLDTKYHDIECGEFTCGILKRIDQGNLTADQQALLCRCAKIVTGEGKL